MADQLDVLTTEVHNLSEGVHSLIAITTGAELVAAVSIVVSAVCIRFLFKWEGERRHNRLLPNTVMVPRPLHPLEDEIHDEVVELYKHSVPRDEGQIDTLAELARALRQEEIQ